MQATKTDKGRTKIFTLLLRKNATWRPCIYLQFPRILIITLIKEYLCDMTIASIKTLSAK